MSLGVQEYLLKPVSASDLKEALERAAGRLERERRGAERAESLRRRGFAASFFATGAAAAAPADGAHTAAMSSVSAASSDIILSFSDFSIAFLHAATAIIQVDYNIRRGRLQHKYNIYIKDPTNVFLPPAP